MSSQILDGWLLVADGQIIEVGTHGSWEELGLAKDASGPYCYRTQLGEMTISPGQRVLLRFGAVSYACKIVIDGDEVGSHIGLWDSFDVDITAQMSDGCSHELTVLVEKPASLTGGPDSDAVGGRYPTREVLAGFLPYVWGHIHGGIWQPVELIVADELRIVDLDAWGAAEGQLQIAVSTSIPALISVEVFDSAGVQVAAGTVDTGVHDQLQLTIDNPRPWSPADPHRYTILASTPASSEPTIRTQVGLRTVGVGAGPRLPQSLTLNGEPVFPRMPLSWGWYSDRLIPDPGRDRVREDLIALKELGFNGVKLCLWFPPEYYFELADELGMLLWVELPMWLPIPTDGFVEQLTAETQALVRQARKHPSVIIYTLGCELGAAVGADVLAPLYAAVKTLARDALVCDNSGSGEAYGGADQSFTDFYDHHLYAELEYLPQTFDHFAPGWREPMPWLFGEFCDYDSYRDLSRIIEQGAEPWWLSKDQTVNPQGARWQFDVQDLPERLKVGGWWERGAELERIGNHGALLHRKVTLEYVRSRIDTAGYVITGERDTPISTAGIFDDHGAVRVDPAAFASFNADSVFLLAPERRRRWTAGGDRIAPLDQWCHPAGSMLRTKVLLAHHGAEVASKASWWLIDSLSGQEISRGTLCFDPHPGVQQIGIIEARLPETVGSVRLLIEGSDSGVKINNSWTFWVMPGQPWSDLGPVGLLDPSGRLADLINLADARQLVTAAQATEGEVVVATRWSAELDQWIRQGGRAVVAVDQHSDAPVSLIAEPFWRESIKVIEPHRLWKGFPHEGVVDLQFFGCATDLAMETAELLGVEPLLRRLDARTGVTHDYAVAANWGEGRVIFTSLRFEGGRGAQPVGLRRNVGAGALLATWVRGLGDDGLVTR